MVVVFLKKYGFDGVIFDSFEKGKEVKNIVVFDDSDIQIIDKQIIKTR
jgi:hypothetical protein